jgi:hypothetical protein
VGEFYYIDEAGISLAKRHTGWRSSWSQIVAGNFGGDGVTDLLFYDAAAGVGQFYAVDASMLTPMHTNTGWRNTWKIIVPGNFGGNSFTDLLFYDAGGTTGEFYSVNQGVISLLNSFTDWRASWNAILTGDFGGNSFDDLLFYDAVGETGEFYTVNNGDITMLRSNTGWRSSWTRILSGTYTGKSGKTPPPNPSISAGVETYDFQNDFRLLHIRGYNFKASEAVSLKITIQDGNETPETVIETTQANGSGVIDYKYSGSGGGVCNPTNIPGRRFTVVGTGETSHLVSNSTVTGCP